MYNPIVQHNYYLRNKRKILKKIKKYYNLNKTKILEYKHNYYPKIKNKKHQYNKEYGLKNKEKLIILRKKQYLKNKKHIREQHRKYIQKKRRTNLNFRMRSNLSRRVISALKGNPKLSTTMNLIDCSIDKLKQYLENKFTEGMVWQNYGKWEIDHIRPCASFDLSKVSEQKKCFHYTNLQPLWKSENRKKKDKI